MRAKDKVVFSLLNRHVHDGNSWHAGGELGPAVTGIDRHEEAELRTEEQQVRILVVLQHGQGVAGQLIGA